MWKINLVKWLQQDHKKLFENGGPPTASKYLGQFSIHGVGVSLYITNLYNMITSMQAKKKKKKHPKGGGGGGGGCGRTQFTPPPLRMGLVAVRFILEQSAANPFFVAWKKKLNPPQSSPGNPLMRVRFTLHHDLQVKEPFLQKTTMMSMMKVKVRWKK